MADNNQPMSPTGYVLTMQPYNNNPFWDQEKPPVPAGEGIPPGGTTGQVLTKKSDEDYDAEWQDPQGGGVTLNVQRAAYSNIGLRTLNNPGAWTQLASMRNVLLARGFYGVQITGTVTINNIAWRFNSVMFSGGDDFNVPLTDYIYMNVGGKNLIVKVHVSVFSSSGVAEVSIQSPDVSASDTISITSGTVNVVVLKGD